jgi:CheY-like chemotaxis protein
MNPVVEPRTILRAELLHHGRSFVAHTLEVTDASAFIRTDVYTDIGDRMLVRLSSPAIADTVAEPLELEAQVVSRRVSTTPGVPTGITVAFVFRSESEERRLRSLLERGTAADTGGARTFRVLLVDDSRIIREMFLFGVRRFYKGMAGHIIVDVAEDAQAAWEMLHVRPYDLAIVDYFLPAGRGSDLVARARQDPELQQVSFVGISGGGPEARDAFVSAGADLFLDKPLAPKDVFTTIGWMTKGAA